MVFKRPLMENNGALFYFDVLEEFGHQ